MEGEFKKMGLDVAFVAINRTDAAEQQPALVERCEFDLLQDDADLTIYSLMDAVKDDIYVYDADGKLAIHLPIDGKISTNLSYDEGYDNLKGIALALAAGE